MHHALIKLHKLRARGTLRQLVRSATTVRGALALLFSVGLLAMMTIPGIVIKIASPRTHVIMSPSTAYDLFSIAVSLFGVVSILTTAGERVIHFSPSEIDFLFAAPVSRRALLIYKIAESWTASVLVALIVSISLSLFLATWIAAFIGILLSLWFIHALTMCLQMTGLIIGEYAYKRSRRILLAVVVILVAWAMIHVATHAMSGSWTDILQQFRESPAARIALAPSRLFANIVFAPRMFPDLLAWTLLGIAVNVLLYALAIVLDANYLEAAVQVSRRWQERVERAKRSGGMVLSGAVTKRRTWTSRVPRFPRWGGLGPLARRQTLLCITSFRGVLLLFMIFLLVAGVPLLINTRDAKNFQTLAPFLCIGALAYVTFLISSQAALSFRGDLEQMPLFKSLPVPVWAIVAGEVLPVAALLAFIQCSVLILLTMVMPGAWRSLAIGCAFALPFNLWMFGMDGVLFLLYPVRFVQGMNGLLNFGKHFTALTLKTIVLSLSAGLVALPGGIAYLVTESGLLAVAASWFASWFPCAALIFLMIWAFKRFDVSELVGD